MGNGDHHFLIGNHVLHRELVGGVFNQGAPRITVAFLYLQYFVGDDLHPKALVGQYRLQVLDQFGHLFKLLHDLVAFQAGQALQAQFKDGFGLHISQPLAGLQLLHIGQFHQVQQSPVGFAGFLEANAAHQVGFRFVRVFGFADQLDHRIQVIQSHEQTLQDVRPFLGLFQFVPGAPHHHLMAVFDEYFYQVAQVQRVRAAFDQRHIVHSERRLQRRVLVQVVEHHIGHRVAFEFVHNPHPVPVRFVADVGNAFHFLFVHQVRRFLDHVGLVHHVRYLGDDNLLAAGLGGLKGGFGTHHHAAPARFQGRPHALVAVNGAAGREVGGFHKLHQFLHRNVRVLDVGGNAFAYFGQVVGSHVGGHAHGNARRAVDEQVGEFGGQHGRLFQRVVEVGAEVNGFLVDVGQQFLGNAFQAGFGVAHGGRRVAVHRAEIALPVHQWVAQAPVLGHAHHGVIHRRIAVRVVLAHDFTDNTRRFLVCLIVVHSQLHHAEQHPAVNRLQAVAGIGQGTRDDDRH